MTWRSIVFFNLTGTELSGRASVELYRSELRCRWRPGERLAYSNPGYQVAGYLLKKFGGQPYEQYLTQHFLHPLAMPDATPTRLPCRHWPRATPTPTATTRRSHRRPSTPARPAP